MKTREQWVEEVMERAQLFANVLAFAWASNRKDDNSWFDNADKEKARLRALLLEVPDPAAVKAEQEAREFDEMTKRGSASWKDVRSDFVDDLRGGKE